MSTICRDRPRPVPARRYRFSRRDFLQLGFSSALAASAPLVTARASSSSDPASKGIPRAKGVLFIFLTGGPSHLDTFDLKPDAPAEVRGTFAPIQTSVPGIFYSEFLPMLASRAHLFALIRTMHCSPSFGSHETGTHAMLAGINELPAGSGLYASRNDWPGYASGLSAAGKQRPDLPSGLLVPHLRVSGAPYCGQNAGFLGARHDPWQLAGDPNDATFNGDESLRLPGDLSSQQFLSRRSLLESMDRPHFQDQIASGQFQDQQTKACETLVTGRFARALDLSTEPPAVRERYGRHLFGQTLLLARRALQAGVPLVQANMGVAGQWDTHTSNCPNLKQYLLPPLDQAVSALLDDMEQRGMLRDFLIVLTGEFGRTPKLGGNVGTPTFSPDGRDHWTQCFSSLFAGAGVHGGCVIGRSDSIAAFPTTRAFTPADLGATIYAALGVDPSLEIYDRLSRPHRLNSGEPITAIYSGREG